ncbi:MAG: L,D-transpeptidase [Hyphomicrobiales bacterium]|nr:L,D-transpeptidase [Hyphomicrobiales bacterium]
MFKKVMKIAAGAMLAVAAVSTSAQALDNWPARGFSSTPSNSNSGFSANSFFGGGSGSGSQMVSFPKKYSAGQIIVSFADRRLYYTTGRGRAISYPIAIPKGEARWSGVLNVSQKKVNPGWTPTASMRRENPKLPAHVPGGHPKNPLGVRALYLGSTLYRIHGTDAPWLIGREVSKGCIRMHNSDVIDLYNRTRVGTRVTVTWNRFSTL